MQTHKPFYQHVEKPTLEQKPYNERAISYMVNESLLSRTLFMQHKIVIGDKFSFYHDNTLKLSVVELDKKNQCSSDELEKFLANHFEDYIVQDWTEAVLTGVYYNFHNDFVFRYYTPTIGYVEIPCRPLATIMLNVSCRLGTIYLVDKGVSVFYNNRIVGTCEKVQQAYADPYTYHKTGRIHNPTTGRVESYSHYDYVIDSLGKQTKTKVA